MGSKKLYGGVFPVGKIAFRLNEKQKEQIQIVVLMTGACVLALSFFALLMAVKMHFTSDEFKLERLMSKTSVRPEPELVLPRPPESSSAFFMEYAHGESTVVDYSTAKQGYIQVKCTTDREALLVLEKDGEQYVEYLPGDGRYYAYPLSMGSGEYLVSVNLHRQGTSYDVFMEVPVRVVIRDELARFTIPNPLLAYDSSPELVEIAQYLYSISENDREFAQNALEWVQLTVSYDISLYERHTESIYRPDLERLLREKTAICGDYASLYASLLRACNIPCQLVYGNVETDQGTIYHAWNMVWLEDEQGSYSWWVFDPTTSTNSAGLGANEKPELAIGDLVYNEPLYIR